MAGALFGSAADRQGRKTALRLGLATFALGIFVVAIGPTFSFFLVGLLLSGAGNLVVDASICAYLGDQVSYQRRGFAVAVTKLGWSGAFVIGIPLVSWLMARDGWHAQFAWLALVGLAATLAWPWVLPADAQKPGCV
jgi:predicted MFS family arabinose efflux permease